MSNIHELGNMIFNLEERKNLKEVNFTKSAVKEVLSYLKELYEIKNKEHEEDRRIADLEAKLAESEDKIKKAYQEGLLQKQFDKDVEIEQLKQQLAKIKEDYEQLDLSTGYYISDLKEELAESESKLRVGNSSLAISQLEYNQLKKEYDEQEKLLSQVLATNSRLQFEFDQLKQQIAEKEN